MAKICLPSEDNCVTQFYSIADDLNNLVNYLADFIMNLSPGMIALMMVTLIGIIVFYVILSIKKHTYNIGKNKS